MFKKVRLKLTLINIAVVGIILLLFLSGIYVLMAQNTRRQSEQFLRLIGTDLRTRAQRPGNPPMIRRFNGSFYVKLDPEGNIIGKSDNIPISDNELSSLINESLRNEKDLDVVKVNNDFYRYFRSFPPDFRSMSIVFMNMQLERDTLARLRAILAFVGLAGLLLVFVSSLFLAGRALIPIREAWEKQQRFVADASHELRSPLAVVRTNLELVLGNRDETVESQSKWLENILAENRRMTKLVNDLLFLARADSNQQNIEKAMFSLTGVIKDVVETYEPLAAGKNIRLTLSLDNNEIEFFGDEGRIKQLAVILLDNAIKYTHEGGTVDVSLVRRDNNIELIVADTGVGIPPEHLSRIFDRFYRVDKARSRDSGGTGLGLSIADWIAKEHKGAISVESTPGKGSTFRVTLPRLLHKG